MTNPNMPTKITTMNKARKMRMPLFGFSKWNLRSLVEYRKYSQSITAKFMIKFDFVLKFYFQIESSCSIV